MLHLPPLAAEAVFNIAGFPITNSFINTLIALVFFAIFAFVLNKAMAKSDSAVTAPTGIVNFFEGILEFLLGYIDGVTHDRKKSLKFLPIVGGLFLFILVSNWMGLIPGTGSIGIFRGTEFIPFFRPANTDLNTTLALAIFAVVVSHLFGIFTIGFFKYANKFVKLGDIWKAVSSGKPVNILVAIIEFFVGLIEVFSELAKMVSLSLRLFGNIFAGEVLLTVIGSLLAGYGAFFVPLPFMALEVIVGIVQATVFAMLTLVYLTIATTDLHGAHEETHHAEATADQTPSV